MRHPLSAAAYCETVSSPMVGDKWKERSLLSVITPPLPRSASAQSAVRPLGRYGNMKLPK